MTEVCEKPGRSGRVASAHNCPGCQEKESVRRYCCVIGCDRDAEFEIWGDFNHPEDNTDACESHVGALLGTPDWAVKMYGREAKSWTVAPVKRDHYRPEEVWDIEPTGWHLEEGWAPALSCYTTNCDNRYHVDLDSVRQMQTELSVS